MSDVALAAVVVIMIIERTLMERSHRTERRHLTNAIVARSAGELVALNAEPKPLHKAESEPPENERAEAVPIGL